MNYLVIGPEGYLKAEFLDKLKGSILRDNKNQLDLDVFHGGKSEIHDVLNSFRTLPIISKQRIVVIKDINRFSPKEKNSILQYLKSPSSSTTLVLESASGEFNKFLNEVSKLTKLVRCDRLTANELDVWIKKEFTVRKKRLSPRALGLIKELAGNDLNRLENEIEKVISFAPDVAEITERHVEAVLGESYYKTAFELVELVLGKKTGDVLMSLDRLLTKEKPHQVLNLLAWQFRNFIKIKNLPKPLFSVDGVSQTLHISRYSARKSIEQSKHFTQADLERNFEVILKTDLSVKSGKIDARYALEHALVKLCG